MNDVEHAIVELAKELKSAREERLSVEPDTAEEAELSGYERGLHEAVRLFESVEGLDRYASLPEWQLAAENENGEWEWYYPHAMSLDSAKEIARSEAKEDLGDGPIHFYEMSGPLAANGGRV